MSNETKLQQHAFLAQAEGRAAQALGVLEGGCG